LINFFPHLSSCFYLINIIIKTIDCNLYLAFSFKEDLYLKVFTPYWIEILFYKLKVKFLNCTSLLDLTWSTFIPVDLIVFFFREENPSGSNNSSLWFEFIDHKIAQKKCWKTEEKKKKRKFIQFVKLSLHLSEWRCKSQRKLMRAGHYGQKLHLFFKFNSSEMINQRIQ
jgi:hypothetical protein